MFFDDDTATLSAVHTMIPMQRIISANTATMVRISEEEFLAGIEEYNEAFQVPQPIQAPMTSDEVAKYDGTFPAEEDWCGGVMSDVSCTPSPYVEPDVQMKGGFIALFVILGVLLFSSVALFFHRKAVETQKKRYKEHFIRGIARNITISDSAGRVSPEQLKKEFDHIDKDKGGTISKDELKTFLKSGKVGDISDKDVEAMWAAIDIDNSGEVDFVVSLELKVCMIYGIIFILPILTMWTNCSTQNVGVHFLPWKLWYRIRPYLEGGEGNVQGGQAQVCISTS